MSKACQLMVALPRNESMGQDHQNSHLIVASLSPASTNDTSACPSPVLQNRPASIPAQLLISHPHKPPLPKQLPSLPQKQQSLLVPQRKPRSLKPKQHQTAHSNEIIRAFKYAKSQINEHIQQLDSIHRQYILASKSAVEAVTQLSRDIVEYEKASKA